MPVGRTGRSRADSPGRAPLRSAAHPTLPLVPRSGREPNEPVALGLRSGTSAAHQALDRHPLLRQLIASDLTRERYADALAAMYRPHAQLERLVYGSRHHAESGLELTARLDLLEADLRDLGRPPTPLPYTTDPGNEDRAAWWGRVYVLEGSRMGAAFIATRVRSSLGDAVPTRFFAEAMASGDQAPLQAMRAHELRDPAELTRAVAGALAAFAAYRAELDAFARADAQRAVGGAA